MSENTVRNGGITFLEMLAIVFIACKITGYVNWSWWWVLAPLWIPFVLVFGILLILGIIGAIVDRR